MPQCYIDNTYMDECIIDPKDGKLRHCSVCEAVIQELRDDYDKADERNKKGRYFAVDDDWDGLIEALTEFSAPDFIEPPRHDTHFLAEEYEPTD